MILTLAHQDKSIALGLSKDNAFLTQTLPPTFESTENLAPLIQNLS